MKPEKRKIALIPKHFHCVHCLANNEEYVTADHLLWDDEEGKVYPLCSECKAIVDSKKKFFDVFSLN
jgi:hypothetical protein